MRGRGGTLINTKIAPTQSSKHHCCCLMPPDACITLVWQVTTVGVNVLWVCSASQVAFDDKGKVAYLIGNTNVYVIDMSPAVLTVTQSAPVGGSELPLLGSK
jgi:hypothetical protein